MQVDSLSSGRTRSIWINRYRGRRAKYCPPEVAVFSRTPENMYVLPPRGAPLLDSRYTKTCLYKILWNIYRWIIGHGDSARGENVIKTYSLLRLLHLCCQHSGLLQIKHTHHILNKRFSYNVIVLYRILVAVLLQRDPIIFIEPFIRYGRTGIGLYGQCFWINKNAQTKQ